MSTETENKHTFKEKLKNVGIGTMIVGSLLYALTRKGLFLVLGGALLTVPALVSRKK